MTLSSLQAQAPRVILSAFSPSNCTALDLTGLSAQILIALTSRRERFLELFFEPLQRVGNDVGMQNSRLEDGQKLPLEILPANQKIILADGVSALRVF
jgi:hypothetical protein